MNFYTLNLSTIFALLIVDQYFEFIPETGLTQDFLNGWLILTAWSVLAYFFVLLYRQVGD